MENIKLHGAQNVRDLGGLPVNGGTVKHGMLIRSSELSTLTDDDIDKLILHHGLTTVIDLRNEQERAEKPDFSLPDVQYLPMPVFDETVPGMSHESKQDIDHIPDMRQLYHYVINSDCMLNVAAVIRKIVLAPDGEYAFLYHCTEGKDRTGVITAILLLLLGADRKTVMDDYLFTNQINLRKAKKYRFLVRYLKRNKPASVKVYNVFLAKEEYLNELFLYLDGIGFDRFVTEVLALTEHDVKAFQHKLIER